MKIVIATGGTGGHLFPAIKVAQELRQMGHEILFMGSFTQGLDKLHAAGFKFEELNALGFKLDGIKSTLKAVVAMTQAFFKSLGFLRRYHPDAVVGFGGYGAFPVVMGAVIWDPETWALQEFNDCSLGDRRRNKRLMKLAVQVAARPDGSTPDQTESWGDLKAAYRLFDAEDVSFQALVAPHCRRTRTDCSPGDRKSTRLNSSH